MKNRKYMKALPTSIFVFIASIVAYTQDAPPSLRTRVKEELPALYADWRLNVLESIINTREHMIQQISFVKDAKALTYVDSILSRRPPTFFEASYLPLERNTITHYGTVKFVLKNFRMQTEMTQDYYFFISRFSTFTECIMIPYINDRRDKLDGPLQTIIDFDGKGKLILKSGDLVMSFEKNTPRPKINPVSVNAKATLWNENGLKGKVSEVFCKIFELRMSGAQVVGQRPVGLLHQKYSKTGLLSYHRESDRGLTVEKKISGSFENRTIVESMSGSQELTITATLIVNKDSSKYDSFVDKNFLFGRKSLYSNGRMVADKRLNYLGNVEEEVSYTYDINGNLYSYEKNTSNDMYQLEVYKYLKFDATGNWTERIVYNSNWEPKRMEIRQVSYY